MAVKNKIQKKNAENQKKSVQFSSVKLKSSNISKNKSNSSVSNKKTAKISLHNAMRDLKQRQAEITALLEASRAVIHQREFKDTARSIFNSCKTLTGATAGYVALLSKDGAENEVLFLDSGGHPCTVDQSLPMPIRGLRETAYSTGRAVYENDFPNSEWVKFMPEGHARLDNVLFAPLVISGGTIGLLGLGNKPGGFSENDRQMATAFGELAAIALNNSRLFEKLLHNEEKFRSLAQNATDAIISIDINGHIILWNNKAEAVFGYKSDEVTGKTLSLIMPERLREDHLTGINRVISTGMTAIIGRTIETTGLRKDGTEFPLELSLAKWETGKGIFFTGIIRDITERKEVEEELKKHQKHLMALVQERTEELQRSNEDLEAEIAERNKTNELLENVFSNVHILIAYLDTNFNFIRVNSKYAEADGRKADFFIGKNHFDLYPHKENGAIFRKVVETGEPYFAMAKPFTYPDHPERGTTFWDWSLKPIKGPDGLVVGLVLSLIDVTGNITLYSELLRSEHLASVGRLAAGVAHEVNNPINGIINYAQMLLNKFCAESKEREIANRIIREGDRVAGIVKSLLSFARENKEEKKLVHINDILADSLALTETQLKKEGIKLAVNIAPGLQWIYAQPQHIEQVFLNLISNARYALNKKYPLIHDDKTLEIVAQPLLINDNPHVRIIFHDHGTGIPEKIKDRIIDPFFTTKPGEEGTGLGLSITHGIIKDHNGKFRIESIEGRFTKAIVDLPAQHPQ